MTRNLVEGLLDEMNRCRELVKQYGEIGPAGAFGRAAIEQDIKNAEKALAGGDVVEMIQAFKALQGCG
jgi:hypothetical protein